MGMRSTKILLIAAVLLLGPASAAQAADSALPEFLGVVVGKTVVRDPPCPPKTACFPDCWEYCPYLQGWKVHLSHTLNPKNADGNWYNYVGVDVHDVVQVMEAVYNCDAQKHGRLLAALRAAFGPGEAQGGNHIVWHPAGGLVDLETFYQQSGDVDERLYIFSALARAKLPTLLSTATRVSAPSIFGIKLGMQLADCEDGHHAFVENPCLDHLLSTASPQHNTLRFLDGNTPEIISSWIHVQADAAGIQSIRLNTRGLAVQDAVMRDLETLFGPAEQRSGGGLEPILARWTVGDSVILFEGAADREGEGRLRLATPQGTIYEDRMGLRPFSLASPASPAGLR